jgi:hypothetical protein
LNDLLELVIEPRWRCRYRGQSYDYKERYQRGIVLYNQLLALHKNTPEIISIRKELMGLALDILSFSKTIEQIDQCFHSIQECIDKVG